MLFPKFFVDKAYNYLIHPMQFKIRPHEKSILDKAKKAAKLLIILRFNVINGEEDQKRSYWFTDGKDMQGISPH